MRPRDIITQDALENAIASVATTGGSTNAVLHLIAIAREAGLELALADFDRISARVAAAGRSEAVGPLRRHRPAQRRRQRARRAAADRSAARSHGSAQTVTGRTLGAGSRATRSRRAGRKSCGRSASALKKSGGLVILRGNLAPEGAVMKVSGTERLQHRGPARVFDSEEAAFEAVQHQAIKAGDVVVIRYEGPSGGPGMREMLGGHRRDCRRRPGRYGGARDRRPLLGRDARVHGRPHRARSVARRPDRGGARRRHDSSSTSPNAQARPRDPAETFKQRLADWRAPAPRYATGVLGKVRAAGVVGVDWER